MASPNTKLEDGVTYRWSMVVATTAGGGLASQEHWGNYTRTRPGETAAMAIENIRQSVAQQMRVHASLIKVVRWSLDAV